ncbi:MAG: hypothetical protein WCG47_11610, partial [Dermatophilaceae bacterium]
PKASSTAYSRNICALLAHLISGGELTVDPADEITAGVLITHGGEVVHPAVRVLLGGVPEAHVGAARTGGAHRADTTRAVPTTVSTEKGPAG